MQKGMNAIESSQKTDLNQNKFSEFFQNKLSTKMEFFNKFQLLFTTISFVLISYSLLLIARNPVTGYEISIYSSTPLIFWISILFGLINGISLLWSSISTRSSKQFYVGFFQVIFFNVLLVLLPKLRNYVLIMGRGDNAEYVGYAKDVSIYGHIFNYNFYPYTSVLISQISQILNTSELEVSKFIPALFTIIYMLSIYCWAKSLNQGQKFTIYSLTASVPLFFAWFFPTIYHMLIASLILPISFYVISKNNDFRFRILAILFCLIIPFAHPIISLIFLSYLICIFFEEQLSDSKSHQVSSQLLMIFIISSFIWYIAQYSLIKNAILILSQIKNALFLNSQGTTTLNVASGYVSKMGLFTAAKSFLIMTFDEFTYYVFSLLSIFFILNNSKKDLLRVSLCFIVGSLFYVFLFITSSAHTPYRLINLDTNMIFAPLLLGYLMVFLRDRYRVVLNLVIILSVITTVASLYQSPITTYPNDHFTAYDISGAKWLLDSKGENISAITVMSSLGRYSSLIYGSNYTLARESLVQSRYSFLKNSSLIDNSIFPAKKTQYFLLTQFEKQTYSTVWKGIGQFNETEFKSIASSKNVNHIYDNQEFSIYLIKPDKEYIKTFSMRK